MIHFFRLFFSLLLLGLSSLLQAEDMLMMRSYQPFPETMSELQEIIKKHGYVVSRVQRVDIGLTMMGYKTDKYRVVFFGKHQEIEKLSDQYPALTAYLPLKIAIFSEDKQTLLVTVDPVQFGKMFPNQDLQPHFQQWSKDVHAIFQDLHKLNENQ
jgi:uncharacterized protein (DUF302 family)